MYVRTLYLSALEEAVTVTKWPFGAVVTRADGRRQPWLDVERENLREHRRRFGGFTQQFYDLLDGGEVDAVAGAAVYVAPDVDDLDALMIRVDSDDEDERFAAIRELEEATDRATHQLAEDLGHLGLEVTRRGRKMPVVHVRGPASALLALASRDDIHRILPTEAGTPVDFLSPKTCPGVSPTVYFDSVIEHEINTVFNDAGLYGAGRRVGILEVLEDECQIDEKHEAFEFASVTHQTYASSVICPHTTNVASVISSSNDGDKSGASMVEIYVANDGEPTHFPAPAATVTAVGCNADATLAAYEWFADIVDPDDTKHGLDVINESYGCVHQAISCTNPLYFQGAEGITQDYFARVYGFPITKASGNQNCTGEWETKHEACPFTLNSICVGSADPVEGGTQMSYFSSFNNPGGAYSYPTSQGPRIGDREEPDLVALGGSSFSSDTGMCVAVAGTPGDWTSERGTSLSAPAVASMIVLLREKCEPVLGRRLRQRELRALLRTAAISGNPHDTAYSTPRPAVGTDENDFFDGGGLLRAGAFASCTDGDLDDLVIDLNGGSPMPKGDTPFTSDWAPPGETQALHAPSLDVAAFGRQPDGAGIVGELVGDHAGVSVGTRIRYTVSWDACTLAKQGDGPAKVPVDFDLFLFRRPSSPGGAGTYVWASQSTEDNNEGFDFKADVAGDYDVYLTWPEGSTSCTSGTSVRVARSGIVF